MENEKDARRTRERQGAGLTGFYSLLEHTGAQLAVEEGIFILHAILRITL